MRRLWTYEESDALYGAFAPRCRRPNKGEREALGHQLGRTPEAIDWMWNDAQQYVRGNRASTTSQRLKDYLAPGSARRLIHRRVAHTEQVF